VGSLLRTQKAPAVVFYIKPVAGKTTLMNNMKSHIRYLFIALLSAAVVIGCKTAPEAALTPAILERMEKLSDLN
jgi:hypothetical protein